MTPRAGIFSISTGTAELVNDPRNPTGWLLVINGLDSSYVDMADPKNLQFEYVGWMAACIDVHAPAGQSLRVVHLGAGGCTLPRYLATTRPASRQLVLETDGDLIDMVTEAFALDDVADLVLQRVDAAAGLGSLDSGSYDVIVRDAFQGGSIPAHLTTTTFVEKVARVLAADGLYLANVPAGPDLQAAEAEAALAGGVFRHVALLVDPGQLHGRRFGNVVVAASRRPLPVTALTRRLANTAPAYVVPQTRRVQMSH